MKSNYLYSNKCILEGQSHAVQKVEQNEVTKLGLYMFYRQYFLIIISLFELHYLIESTIFFKHPITFFYVYQI